MSKQHRTRRAVKYGRVSRLNGRDTSSDRFHSLDEQHDVMDGIVKAKSMRTVASFEDTDESGSTIDRPGFQAALKMIDDGDADTLVVARLTRFARSVTAAHEAAKRIRDAGGSLIIGDLDLDTATPTGKMLFTILSAVAEFELDLKRESWRDVQIRAMEKGRKVGATPIGYVIDAKLVPCEKYADAVRDVFAMRAAGASWKDIRVAWHARTGEWRGTTTFASMVRNRTYLGELRLESKDENVEPIVFEHAHDALVDPETFDAAQSSDENRKPRAPRRDGSLLAGIATCASCGGKLTHQRGRYVCQRANRTGVDCPRGVTIQAARLDAHVEQLMLAWAGDLERETVADDDENALAELDRRERELTSELAAFVAKLSATSIEQSILDAEVDRRQGQIDDVRRERDEFVANRRVAGVRSTLRDVYPHADLAGRRRVLAAAIDSLIVAPTSAPGTRANPHAPVADRVSLVWRRDD